LQVVFTEATPTGWLFTSKSGDVLKKRDFGKEAIADRFTKIALSNPKNTAGRICVCRYKNGSFAVLDEEEFSALMTNFPPGDTNLLAIQPYVQSKGGNGAIHRNSYTIVDDKAKCVTATQKIVTLAGEGVAPIITVKPEQKPALRSFATKLNSQLDAITRSIVRHVENVNRVRILSFSADYLVDDADQIWFHWATNITIASGDAAADLRLADIRTEGTRARVPTALKALESKSAPNMMSVTASALDYAADERRDFDKKNEDLLAGLQVGGAIEHLEADKTQMEQHEGQDKKRKGSRQFNITAPEKYEYGRTYPTPFVCKGKYCSFCIQEPSLLNEKENGGASDWKNNASKLFSGTEWSSLQNQLNVPLAAGDKKNVAFSITQKSISLADLEKRGLESQLTGGEEGGEDDADPNSRSASRVLQDTISKSQKTTWSGQRGELIGGTANYYRQVKVCYNCYVVYTTLDNARTLLEEERQKKLRLEKAHTRANWAAEVRAQALLQASGQEEAETIAREVRRMEGVQVDDGSVTPDAGPAYSGGAASGGSQRQMTQSSKGQMDSVGFTGTMNESTRAPKQSRRRRAPWREAEETMAKDGGKSAGDINLQKNFAGLDGYLRGTGTGADLGGGGFDSYEPEALYRAKVLLADEDETTLRQAQTVLETEYYRVTTVRNGTKAFKQAQEEVFDVLVLSRQLPGMSAMDITRQMRRWEAQQDPPQRLPIICYTESTTPEDLRLYMECGMDGCVGKPLDEPALLNTLQAAVPKHQHEVDPNGGSMEQEMAPAQGRPKTLLPTKSNMRKAIKTSRPQASASNVAQALSMASSAMKEVNDDGSVSGTFQLDADTSIPYTILGSPPTGSDASGHTFFNFVVCHDIFDTCERMQLFFRPLISRYPGAQVLVWNYPGQAFTKWRRDVLLNNEFLAGCLAALLQHTGPEGTGEFSSSPYFLMGFGNGGNIASYYATHSPASLSPIRSLLLVNSFSFVDAHLAGIMHDFMNVFSCSPATRPDLPVYFHTRFLFSGAYLTQTSTPLALNLYTAVHNPITVEGRIQLCLGALAHVDLRSSLEQMQLPTIILHSAQNGFVKPLHVEALLSGVQGQVRSIHKCLKSRASACVIWMRAGHEMFQECRRSMSNLLEQLVTGYHEVHDVAYMPTTVAGGADGSAPGGKKGEMEDRFIDNVLGSLDDVRDQKKVLSNPFGESNHDHGMQDASMGSSMVATQSHWDDYKDELPAAAADVSGNGNMTVTRTRKGKTRNGGGEGRAVLNPAAPAFERQQNVVYTAGHGSRIYPNASEMPEVREYMSWRLKRNKKQLLRLSTATQCIQRSFRAFMARSMVQKMREQKAVLFIQRVWRGARGRRLFAERRKMEWAVRLLQRNWRGHLGREKYLQRRAEEAAASNMQRVYRGRLAKRRVAAIKFAREQAACRLQNMYRARNARRVAFAKRIERNAAINLQRCFRGHQGRRRAAAERDKYLFSKSQTQGIEFGRQMLLEHKLHGTRLQSEVTLLTQEKVKAEEDVEGLLEEISEFEQGVLTLEKEMHELSKVETEAAGVLDEDSRAQLREQKRRLDKEFGIMLAKISDRKERLLGLEDKLQKLDRARQVKEEELRDLERKLVVLLEEQQKELEQIRRRQEKKGELLKTAAETATPELMQALVPVGGAVGGGGGGGGPTPQQKQQANALMQSTETLMKFGFMSMSMTYFSSLNMVKALRQVGAHQTLLGGDGGGGMEQMMGGGGMGGGGGGNGKVIEPFKPGLKPGMMPGQEPLLVAAWSVDDVGRWLDTLSLPQYRQCFADAAVDGAFLYDLNDEVRNMRPQNMSVCLVINCAVFAFSAGPEEYSGSRAQPAQEENPQLSCPLEACRGTRQRWWRRRRLRWCQRSC
jgi:CheY-like chemotaxis protein/pimeloyl-ACP methyl ester carboxylesterase